MQLIINFSADIEHNIEYIKIQPKNNDFLPLPSAALRLDTQQRYASFVSALNSRVLPSLKRI